MANLELAPPCRQKSWGWPAIVNFTLGGAGTGIYLFGSIFSVYSNKWPTEAQMVSFQVLSILMVCLGFLALLAEAGKPMRAARLFTKVSHSWMSIESLFGSIFLAAALASFLFTSFFFTFVACAAAFFLMVSQGMMVYRSVAVLAWNRRIMPYLFISNGFMTAGGVVLLNTRTYSALDPLVLYTIILVCTINLTIWLLYILGGSGKDFFKATRFLRHPLLLFLIVVTGQIIPLTLLFLLFHNSPCQDSYLFSLFAGISAGLLLFSGGACQKTGIVWAAGYYRRMILDGATNP